MHNRFMTCSNSQGPLTVRARHKAIVHRLQREVMAEQFDHKGQQ